VASSKLCAIAQYTWPFIDLPQAIQLAKIAEGESEKPESNEIPATIDETAASEISEASVAPPTTEAPSENSHATSLQDDPLALLAQAAGYTDHELWWERQIEQRHNATGLFESILEAMSELRADAAPKDEQEAQREAHMRQMIRAARKTAISASLSYAEHGMPGTHQSRTSKTDTEILKGLKRIKTEATWIPGLTRVYLIAAAMAQELIHRAGTNISGLFPAMSLPAG